MDDIGLPLPWSELRLILHPWSKWVLGSPRRVGRLEPKMGQEAGRQFSIPVTVTERCVGTEFS